MRFVSFVEDEYINYMDGKSSYDERLESKLKGGVPMRRHELTSTIANGTV